VTELEGDDRRRDSPRLDLRSFCAGSTPSDEINPAVLAVIDEIGLDLSKEFPKPLTTEAVEGADVLISMGCGDACPIFPGKRYLDWDLPNPAGKPLGEVRPIRDDIEQRVRGLMAELGSLRSKRERTGGRSLGRRTLAEFVGRARVVAE
jgi:arsenate reductase